MLITAIFIDSHPAANAVAGVLLNGSAPDQVELPKEDNEAGSRHSTGRSFVREISAWH